jgi:hormone-sensitive lipase
MNILSQNGNLTGIKKLTQKWESAGKVLKVALFKENALHEAEVMISNPSEVLAKEIWNLPERA